jgi:hypothetical protein
MLLPFDCSRIKAPWKWLSPLYQLGFWLYVTTPPGARVSKRLAFILWFSRVPVTPGKVCAQTLRSQNWLLEIHSSPLIPHFCSCLVTLFVHIVTLFAFSLYFSVLTIEDSHSTTPTSLSPLSRGHDSLTVCLSPWLGTLQRRTSLTRVSNGSFFITPSVARTWQGRWISRGQSRTKTLGRGKDKNMVVLSFIEDPKSVTSNRRIKPEGPTELDPIPGLLTCLYTILFL